METVESPTGIPFEIPVDPQSWLDRWRVGRPARADRRDRPRRRPGTRLRRAPRRGSSTPSTVTWCRRSPDGAGLRLVSAEGTPLAVVPVAVEGSGHGNADGGDEPGRRDSSRRCRGSTGPPRSTSSSTASSWTAGRSAPPPPVGASRSRRWVGADARRSSGRPTTRIRGAGTARRPRCCGAWTATRGSRSQPTSPEPSSPSRRRHLLPGGDRVHVQVIANDGVRTGEATSEPFGAPTHGPVVAIAGAAHRAGRAGRPRRARPPSSTIPRQRVEAAVAPTGGIDVARTTDARVDHGSGARHPGPPGRTCNTISLIVTDPDGNEAHADVLVEVVERTSPTRHRMPDPEPSRSSTNEFTTPTTTTTTAIDFVPRRPRRPRCRPPTPTATG